MNDDYSCGTTASRILFGYAGLQFPEEFKSLANPVRGTSPETLEAILRSGFGGVAWGNGWTLKDLDLHLSLDRPVICLVSTETPNDHWVVVRGISGGRVHLQDPDRGRRSLGYAKWLKSWYGPAENDAPGYALTAWLV